jgi:hypothetical protein
VNEDLEEPWATDPDAWKGGEAENPLGLPRGGELLEIEASAMIQREGCSATRDGDLMKFVFVVASASRATQDEFRFFALGCGGIWELVFHGAGRDEHGRRLILEHWRLVT